MRNPVLNWAQVLERTPGNTVPSSARDRRVYRARARAGAWLLRRDSVLVAPSFDQASRDVCSTVFRSHDET